jgi:DNA-binding LytR/AlgR family response regulator
MSIKCLIIDDEPLAIKVLENHISKIPWLEVAASCLNPVDALTILRTRKIDLLFLDIQMPELNGLDFLRTVSNPPAVIFTTAYRQFAAEAYDLDGLDYLLKPIAFPRFIKAVNKYSERVMAHPDPVGFSGSQVISERKHFFIRQGREMIKVYLDEIIFIESLRDYIRINLKVGSYLYKARITDMEEELKDDQFIRIHKSYLINRIHIHSVTPTEVKLATNRLPIGRTYRLMVLAKLGIEA